MKTSDRQMDASRRRARRGSRGAAMVEAVIVIPFFITMLASIGFMGSLYRQKLSAEEQTRATAWTSAVSGCEDVEREGHLPGTDGKRVVAATTGLPGAEILSQGFGHVTAVESREAASQLVNAFRATAASSTTLICDELPASGDLASITSAILTSTAGREQVR